MGAASASPRAVPDVPTLSSSAGVQPFTTQLRSGPVTTVSFAVVFDLRTGASQMGIPVRAAFSGLHVPIPDVVAASFTWPP